MKLSYIRRIINSAHAGFEGGGNLQEIISNTGWLVADRIPRLGVGLLIWIWIARYLGPEQFGLLNFCIAFVALFAVFSKLGLDGIVVRDVVRDVSLKEEILGTAFLLKLTGGIVTVMITFAAISILRPNDQTIWWLISIVATGVIFQAFDAIDLWFQSKVQSKYSVLAKHLAFLIIIVAKIVLIVMEAPLIAFVWAVFFESVLCAVGLVVAYRFKGYFISLWRVKLGRAKQLLSDSWPLILSGLAIAIYMHIDQVMLGEMTGDRAVGIYSAAARLSTVWYFIPVAILSSIYPSILEAKTASEHLYQTLTQKVFNLMSLLAYSIAIPISLISGWFVATLYGGKYIGAAPVLVIHIWAGLFVFLGVAREKWMITEGLTKFSFATTAIGAASNVLFNYFLIPRYGAVGAAVSTLASYSLAVLLSCLFYKRTRPIAFVMLKALVFKN